MLRLHPCEGTGRKWRITLEIGTTWLAADIGERWRETWGDDEIMAEAIAIAAILGLKLHPGSRHPHWTWT